MQRSTFLAVLMMCHLPFGTALSEDGADAQPKDVSNVVTLLTLVIDADESTATECLGVLTRAVANREVTPAQVAQIRSQLADRFKAILNEESHPLRTDVALLTTLWKDPLGTQISRQQFGAKSLPVEQRVQALSVLIASQADGLMQSIADVISGRQASKQLRIAVIEMLGGVNDPEMAKFLIDNYADWEADVQPRVIEVLTQRPAWTVLLLKAVKEKQITKDALNLNQLQRIALFKNEELQTLVTQTYGAVRQGRSDRQGVINRHRDFLNGTPGDPQQGIAAFKKVCGQCHKIYGEGAEVGPDITRNGRNNWEQLLQNVFDPSAVIGPGYQARTLVTADGRVLTGLPVEESDQRVVLKIQGGKLETIPRDQIEAYAVSEVSMMPEQLEKQLTPQEIADLFAYLALDKPPGDPEGKYLPGAPRHGH